MPDYNAASNPNHVSSQFPVDCAFCHNTTAWDPSTFNHNLYFPIYNGAHSQVWNTCSTCHSNPYDFTVFRCIECHEHSNQSQVNGDHNGVNGYAYNNDACYNCHPDGTH